jgi:hypothetical protein
MSVTVVHVREALSRALQVTLAYRRTMYGKGERWPKVTLAVSLSPPHFFSTTSKVTRVHQRTHQRTQLALLILKLHTEQ